MKVTVIGSGYVGLVSGACLAEMGNDVLCLDVDPAKIALLEGGGLPIHEPGLDAVVARNIGRHMTDYRVAVDKSTVPVGTADKVRAAIAQEFGARKVEVRYAELTKCAANAMLATRISFMNELALLAESLGADIELARWRLPTSDGRHLAPGSGRVHQSDTEPHRNAEVQRHPGHLTLPIVPTMGHHPTVGRVDHALRNAEVVASRGLVGNPA